MLPSISKQGAKQCTALSKRTKLPCNNPAAYGCKSCRMHGARRPSSIKRGKDHPNYVHGERTLDAEKKSSEQSLKLQQLEDAMHVLGMTTAKRSRGRKALGYVKVNSVNDIKKVFGE